MTKVNEDKQHQVGCNWISGNKNVHREDSPALEQGSREVLVKSLLVDFQTSTRPGSEQPDLTLKSALL